jgi:drug/metabolite transporter (DMT)-like permease
VNTAEIVIAVPAALAAACSFGAAAALQHQQAHRVATARVPPFRLLSRLARRPLWLAGIALAAAAYGLQAIALAFGPLALVAPIVATDLVFALVLAAWWSRRPLHGRDWTGCGLVAGGVASFLVISPPSSGRSDAPASDWLLAFSAVAFVAVLAAGAGLVIGGALRPAMLATAAGVIFGLTAAVTLSLTRLLRDTGIGSVLGSWQPWALISLGTAGLILSVGAYQAGVLAASLPIIDTVEPIAGVLIGTVVFGEQLAGSPGGFVIQLAAATVAVVGIALLSPSALTVRAATADNTSGPGQRSPAREEGLAADANGR